MGRVIKDQEIKFYQNYKRNTYKRSQTNAIITLVFENDDDYYYLDICSIFKKILLRMGKDKYFYKKSQENRGEETRSALSASRKKMKYTALQFLGHFTPSISLDSSLVVSKSLIPGRTLQFALNVPPGWS
jgi:hypothetical protein